MAFIANGASWIFYSSNHTPQIKHFHCDSKKQQACVKHIIMLILKNTLFHKLLDSLSYWTTLMDTDFDKIA